MCIEAPIFTIYDSNDDQNTTFLELSFDEKIIERTENKFVFFVNSTFYYVRLSSY